MSWSEETGFACTICSAPKGESTNWRLALLTKIRDLAIGEFCLGPWDAVDSEQRRDPQVAHLCGDKCSHVALSRYLETGTFDAPAVRSEAAGK